MGQQFPPTQYIVPEVLPEGLTLLVAAPKIGKPWMVLGLGVACADGGDAFGHIKVGQRPVLYLALGGWAPPAAVLLYALCKFR